MVDSSVGELKVFTHSTLESGDRKIFTTNIIKVHVLSKPLPNYQELLVRCIYCKINQLKSHNNLKNTQYSNKTNRNKRYTYNEKLLKVCLRANFMKFVSQLYTGRFLLLETKPKLTVDRVQVEERLTFAS